MASPTSVEAGEARAALASVVPRLTALIRSVGNPAAPTLGEWNASDVAVHLAQVWKLLPKLARGQFGSPLQELSELAGLTSSMVRSESERDLETAASRRPGHVLPAHLVAQHCVASSVERPPADLGTPAMDGPASAATAAQPLSSQR